MSDPSHDQFLPHFLPIQADLRAFIGAAVRDVVTREDVFQEVAMILWKKFDLYDPVRPFGAWARGIAIRKILEDRRLRGKLPETCTAETLEAHQAIESAAQWLPKMGYAVVVVFVVYRIVTMMQGIYAPILQMVE